MNIKFVGFIFLFLISACNFSHAQEGVAIIKGTQEDSQVSGEVHLTETADGLKIEANLMNVEPAGKHGFHIHQYGSCDNGGKAAGGHYNPKGIEHGFLETDGLDKAHAGDLGNITIGEDGSGSLSVVIPGLTLSGGGYNVAGRAFILHAQEDDGGQPTGNAGARIGCGSIVLIKPAE